MAIALSTIFIDTFLKRKIKQRHLLQEVGPGIGVVFKENATESELSHFYNFNPPEVLY